MIIFTYGKKAKLLDQGINLDLYKEPLIETNSRATVCNGLFLKYNEKNLETSVKVRINPKSEYFLVNRNRKLKLLDQQGKIFLEDLEIIKSNIKSKIFTEQLSGIIATSLYGCQLANIGKQCKFCSSQKYKGLKFSKKEFKRELEDILKKENINALTINGGSFPDLKYKGYELMSDYVKIAKETEIKEINIELMPNPEIKTQELKKFFKRIKKEGVTSIQFNIEIWDLEKRKRLMPYKGLIPIQTYLDYIKEGSNYLGEGKISSVLLTGLNSSEDLLKGSKRILKNRGIPSLEVFRALPNTELENFQTNYNLEEILNLTETIKKKINLKFKDKTIFEGCVKCGGCSLNK